MIFKVKVEYFSEFENKMVNTNLFLAASNIQEAVKEVDTYFGDTLEELSIGYFAPDNFIQFDNEEMFTMVKETLEKDIVW